MIVDVGGRISWKIFWILKLILLEGNVFVGVGVVEGM